MEEYNLCDDCKYSNTNPNKKPCDTCYFWIDGYLDAVNYEPKDKE